MQYEVTVKPDDGQRAGWEIEYFTWDADTQTQGQEVRIVFGKPDDGVFSGAIDLEGGTYGFGCTVVGPGRKIEVDLAPPAQIHVGADPNEVDPEWPQTCEVPGLQQQELITIYFQAESGQ